MLGALERLPLLKPFGLVTMAVRNNCPWYRRGFTPTYFPFELRKKLLRRGWNTRTSTPAGRLVIMRRILQEKHFLAWGQPTKAPEKRLSYPL
ncbi:hypothetical protein DdX_11972 [Ditylenchus destructor]|uniref:39S ribosomal protein L34, mitochondrial n=1 Tax=Ditylenchus destructor TaxID=166010 RepID=A0AAD4R456_9BILA|nr:hypothetical protein DdX_11969 [Ditylenchus destructor]KAI1708292.1 hypothetical protein DdX_11972 [Ditylenchus destructor]